MALVTIKLCLTNKKGGIYDFINENKRTINFIDAVIAE